MRRLFPALPVLLLAFAALALPPPVPPVPLVLTQEGRLLDGSDQPVNGVKHVVFQLHLTDNGNTHEPKWKEERDVTFAGGTYAVVLGDTTNGHGGTALTDDLLAQPALYLSLTVDGAELLPRLRITSAVYALRAARAAQSESVLANGVNTDALQDGAVTLAKLSLHAGKFVGLDSDTLDGLDSSAFAPASIEATIGTPPAGSSIARELASVRATAEAGATAAAVDALGIRVDGVGAALGAKVDGVGSSVGVATTAVGAVGTKVDAVETSVSQVGTRVDAVKTALGSPAGASVSADVATLAAAVTSLTTQVTALQTELANRKWKSVTGTLYANLDAMLAQYPLSDWQWGIAYNGYSIVPVTLNTWNAGVRISSTYTYPQGDTGSTLYSGGFTLLKGLSDSLTAGCNAQGKFLHYYTTPNNPGAITYSGNGCLDLALYVRRY